jgi:hypothetical protein
VGGEPQREQVAALECERNRRALPEPPQPESDVDALRSLSAESAAAEKNNERHGDRNRCVDCKTPGERDDAKGTGQGREDGEADEPARPEAEGGNRIAVLRGEDARRQGREQLTECGGHEDDKGTARDPRRGRRQAPRDEHSERMREHRHEQAHRHGENEEGDPIRTGFTAEPSVRGGSRQVGHDDEPECLRRENEERVDGVRGEEAVRLGGAAELVREEGPCSGGGQRERHLRKTGDESAAKCAPGREQASDPGHGPIKARISLTVRSYPPDVSARAGDIAGLRPRLGRLGSIAGSLSARIASWPPMYVLGGAVVAQWAVVFALARTVRHNGWVYYQGGDQLWYYTLARLVSHGQLWQTPVGYLWSFVLAPFARLAGADLVSALPAIVLLDVLVLLPIALLAVYGIASRLGGRMFGYWALLVWLVVPFVGILYTNTGYHQRYTELLLPQGFGLTAMADFPTMVAVVVSIYFITKTLLDRSPAMTDAAAAGAAAGAAIAIKPSAALILAGPVLALVVAGRARLLAPVAAAFALPLITLAVWKARGLGNLPLLSSHGGGAPRGVAAIGPMYALNAHKYFGNLSWHQLALNIDLLREHFWSGHLAVWLLLAGLVAVGRSSWRMFALLAGVVLPLAVVKAAYPQANFEDGSLFRLLIPIYPFFVVGLAALPLLLPGAPSRLGAFRPVWRGPSPRARAGLVGAALVLAAIVPLAVTAAATTGGGALHAANVINTQMPIPVDAIRLHAQTRNGAVLVTWQRQRPIGGSVFYRVWRAPATPGGGLTCTRTTGAASCTLDYGTEVGVTRDPARYDKPGPGNWAYRVGVAANWLNDPAYGDVYFTSKPVIVTVP